MDPLVYCKYRISILFIQIFFYFFNNLLINFNILKIYAASM